MRWEVRLNGDEVDLRMFAEALAGPEWIISERDSVFFLGGSDFDQLGDAPAVRDRALEVVALMSGALNLTHGCSKPIDVGHVVRTDAEGKQHFLILADTVTVSMRVLPVTLSFDQGDGTVQVVRPADPAVALLRKASQNKAAEKVLRLWKQREPVWTDLYRIFEVIEGEGGIKASKEAVGRFTQTANSVAATGDLARHGKKKIKPPPKPMTLQEARALIAWITVAWLASI